MSDELVTNGMDFTIPKHERKPYRCPICRGNGLVSSGFYNQTSGYWSTGDTAFETCRSCNGTGVIWG